ncbi:putative proline dehydrogenase 2, partial [Sigmodon hispidus]
MLRRVSHHGPLYHLMVASHNEETVHQATKRMWELGIPLDGPVYFGQLLGMCDHVSLALAPSLTLSLSLIKIPLAVSNRYTDQFSRSWNPCQTIWCK